MLYNIILSEPSMFFYMTCDLVTVTVTASCDWCMTTSHIVWQWCHANPYHKSPIKTKEMKMKNEKRNENS